jgi:molybdopterin synthase catalytic subunit
MSDVLRVLNGPVRLVRAGGGAVDTRELEALVRTHAAGAVVVFLGTTRADREEGGVIEALEYEAARPLADDELGAVAAEAAQRFALSAIAVHHTLGHVPVGTASLGVALAAPHRAEAFAAMDWVVHAIKSRVPVWKRNVLHGARAGVWAEGTPVPHAERSR